MKTQRKEVDQPLSLRLRLASAFATLRRDETAGQAARGLPKPATSQSGERSPSVLPDGHQPSPQPDPCSQSGERSPSPLPSPPRRGRNDFRVGCMVARLCPIRPLSLRLRQGSRLRKSSRRCQGYGGQAGGQVGSGGQAAQWRPKAATSREGGAHAPRVQWLAPSPTRTTLMNGSLFGDSVKSDSDRRGRRSAHARARVLPISK
jgi:hypothetical protein